MCGTVNTVTSVTMVLEFLLGGGSFVCFLNVKLGSFPSQNYGTINKIKHQLRSKRDIIPEREAWETALEVSFLACCAS